MKRFYALALVAAAVLDSPAADHTLTVRVTNDNGLDGSTMPIANLYGAGIKNQQFGMGTWTFTVPDGRYVFCGSCMIFDARVGEDISGCVLAEAEVAGSDAEVVIDLSEVKNSITYTAYTPDGSVAELPEFVYETGGHRGGNIGVLISSIQILHKEFGVVGGTGGAWGERSLDVGKMVVNDLDEDFVVVNTVLMSARDGFYLTASAPLEGVSGDMSVDLGKAYGLEYEARFAGSPLGTELRQGGELPVDDYCASLVGVSRGLQISTSIFFPCSSPVGKVIYDPSVRSLPFPVGVRMSYNDYAVTTETGFTAYPVEEMPVLFNEEEPVYFFANPVTAFRLSDDGCLPVVQPEGHPRFSHTASQRLSVPGDNCPVIVACPSYQRDWDNPENSGYVYGINSIGRMGENNMSAAIGMTYADGLTTINNILVDGLQGRSTLRMTQAESDVRVAAVQQLQFRDRDGNVTDRFDSGDDGTIMIAGGDFVPVLNEQGGIMNFTIGDVVLEAAYSPYGEDDWTALEVAEKPDDYFEPGYGHFWEGSLAGVTRGSATGWYDLKLRVSGNEGNSSEYTVSPAFKIKVPGSVKGARADSADEIDEWYTLQGVRVARPGSGVYIHRTAGGVTKVVRP